ncbi:hypothetical protein B0H13DRAFT_1864666 [Mycena leptocephala]|nr:hypothetical protein B0H13DRAFT_1864666 [Mycena leptocephala]
MSHSGWIFDRPKGLGRSGELRGWGEDHEVAVALDQRTGVPEAWWDVQETNFNSGLWDTYAPAFGPTNDAAAEGLGARSGFSNPLHQLASHKDYPLIPAVGGWMAFNNFDDMAFRKDCRQPWPAKDPITFQREDSSYIAPQDIRLNGGLADSDGLDLGIAAAAGDEIYSRRSIWPRGRKTFASITCSHQTAALGGKFVVTMRAAGW